MPLALPGPADDPQVRAFLSALSGTVGWSIEGGQLRLSKGATTLVFDPS